MADKTDVAPIVVPLEIQWWNNLIENTIPSHLCRESVESPPTFHREDLFVCEWHTDEDGTPRSGCGHVIDCTLPYCPHCGGALVEVPTHG